ncbi:MAG: pyridoxal phosphate-dependent aminotransferase [Fimbriimonadaceae bacterium]|nr:pyridoxal phosphate-dependent aminotransferase [Fimbriimonadaceae bacterium]
MKSLSSTRGAVQLAPLPHPAVVEEIDLSGDLSHYTVPGPVAEAVVHAAQQTDLGRSTAAGGRPLREALVAKLEECNQLEVSPDRVIVTAGGTMACNWVLAALTDPGDAVLVPDPGWPGFRQLAAGWGLQVVAYPLRPDGRPDYAALDELAGHDTKALIVSHPHNPTGAVLSCDDLVQLLDWCRAHDLYLISDETYDLLRYAPGPAIGAARFDTDGRVVSLFSFATTHALAGLRLGYAVAAPPVALAIDHVQRTFLAGPSCLALAAGLAALEMDLEAVESMRSFFAQQAATLQAVLPPGLLPLAPQAGFLALLDISGTALPDGDDFAAACLQQSGLRLAPGSWFGERSRGCVRLSLAARERAFGMAIERLLSFLEGLES